MRVTNEQVKASGQTWTIRIDRFRPARDNELIYCHWTTARKRKRRDAAIIEAAALAASVPKATGRRRLKLTVRGPFKTWPDDTAYLKSCLDGCVKAGVLKDDSREFLEFVWPPTYERSKTFETVLELEDL